MNTMVSGISVLKLILQQVLAEYTSINVLSPLTLLLTQCTYINYKPIHTYIIHLHIYIHIHTHMHASIYVDMHTRIAVQVYMIFCLLMEVWMVRVYRILRDNYATPRHKHSQYLFCY